MRVRWEDFGDKENPVLKEESRIDVLAKRVTVNINDYSQADTFEAEIDYKNFPFDPRCVRSVGIVIAIEDTGRLFTDTNSLNPLKITDDNRVFLGFADEESITFDDSKKVVRLEGRDQTAILIDRKYLKGTVNLEQPVDVVIKELLAELTETQNLIVENRTGKALPALAKYWDEKGELSGKKNVKRDENYWEVIQDIVSRVGLIAYVEIDRLVITEPRVLYDKSRAKTFVYGKNISNLEFKRKIGRKKGFNIVVRSLNLENKEVLEAKIPAEATAEWSQETGVAALEVKLPEVDKDGNPVEEKDAKPAPYISFKVPNVSNKEALIQVGQKIYEEIGRQQIEGSFETFEMKTIMSGSSGVFDILKLRNGTPINIEIDVDDLRYLKKSTSAEDRENYLRGRKYPPRVARALVESIGNNSTPFYTKAVTFTLDASSGFKCKVDFINFIEIPQKYRS